MGMHQINIIDKNFYKKFKKEHDRICKKLKKDSISQEEYDKYNKLVCRKVLKRELGESYNQILKKAGCKVNKKTFTKEESVKLNEDILKLRLKGFAYDKIAKILGIGIMTVKKRVDKIYEASDSIIKDKLDGIKAYNKEKWHIKEKIE